MRKYIFAIVFISNLFAQVDYNTEIQTIFNANCTSCHMYGNASGGLTLTSYSGVMTNSNSGASVIPGDHANSLLWQKVNSGQMPPQNNPDLTSNEVDLIAQWIDEGALEVNNIDCYADDGTDGVELWGECYSIEETTNLSLHEQGLTGEIPPEIGNLINLTSLYLFGNYIYGEIPSEIGNLTNLTYLGLWDNQLNGEIPIEIGNLVNLNSFLLHENQLSGSIPSSIGNLISVTNFRLNDNILSGEIPIEIGNLVNLNTLCLQNNQLNGEIPESICETFPLSWGFSISNNNLCPPYPNCVEDYVGYQDTTNCEQVSIIDETLPVTYKLYNAYPNPFNPVTTLHYDLPEDGLVNITIYDMMGRVVSNLVSSQQNAGYKSIQWNSTNNIGQPVSAGLYLYTIQAGDYTQTKKMVLLK